MEKYYYCSSCKSITPSDKPIKKCECGGELSLGIERGVRSFIDDEEEEVVDCESKTPFCQDCGSTDLKTIDDDPKEDICIFECKKCHYISIFSKEDLK